VHTAFPSWFVTPAYPLLLQDQKGYQGGMWNSFDDVMAIYCKEHSVRARWAGKPLSRQHKFYAGFF
jgi:hypothetical protein